MAVQSTTGESEPIAEPRSYNSHTLRRDLPAERFFVENLSDKDGREQPGFVPACAGSRVEFAEAFLKVSDVAGVDLLPGPLFCFRPISLRHDRDPPSFRLREMLAAPHVL